MRFCSNPRHDQMQLTIGIGCMQLLLGSERALRALGREGDGLKRKCVKETYLKKTRNQGGKLIMSAFLLLPQLLLRLVSSGYVGCCAKLLPRYGRHMQPRGNSLGQQR